MELQLLEDIRGCERALIREYRFDILRILLGHLRKKGTNLEEIESLILEKADTFQGDLNGVFDAYQRSCFDRRKQEKKVREEKEVKAFIKENRYIEMLPEVYRLVNKEDRKSVLKGLLSAFLYENVKKLEVDQPADEIWLQEQIMACLEYRQKTLRPLLENVIRKYCVQDYKTKMHSKSASINVIPGYARTMYSDIKEYRDKLWSFCTTDTLCQQLEDEAWEKQWQAVVPEEAVERYFAKGETALKEHIRKMAPLMPKPAPASTNTENTTQVSVSGQTKVINTPSAQTKAVNTPSAQTTLNTTKTDPPVAELPEETSQTSFQKRIKNFFSQFLRF